MLGDVVDDLSTEAVTPQVGDDVGDILSKRHLVAEEAKTIQRRKLRLSEEITMI